MSWSMTLSIVKKHHVSRVQNPPIIPCNPGWLISIPTQAWFDTAVLVRRQIHCFQVLQTPILRESTVARGQGESSSEAMGFHMLDSS